MPLLRKFPYRKLRKQTDETNNMHCHSTQRILTNHLLYSFSVFFPHALFVLFVVVMTTDFREIREYKSWIQILPGVKRIV